MFGARHTGWNCWVGGDLDDSGYVETDSTGRYGRYEEILGKGAMKTVYRAFDELQGIEVAWNQARISDVMRSPDALERLYSEVYLLGSLNHDSIISFHASWVDTEGRTFNFITELFTSGTLREYRQKHKHVDIRAVKNWARQILNGLAYLHSHDPPVIHRDLKCDNIFVNGHLGQVKIGDLGLAAVLKGSQPAHSVIGTPEFMAPELYDEEYNELVDIYSFGMCLLEMLCGDYPYSECSNPAQIYKKVTSGKLPNAFYQIKDQEAQLFIGRCLGHVSKRPSALELLMDPFLKHEDVDAQSSTEKFLSNSLVDGRVSHSSSPTKKKQVGTEIKITGKINPNDDTIYLKVQIVDKHGSVTNVYFPFDIRSDTPHDVANEMVKELEIKDRDSSMIAEVINQEISALVPHWNNDTSVEIYNYNEDDSFHNYSSSPTSSECSSFSRMQLDSAHSQSRCDWLQDMYDDDDETISDISTYSKYTYVNYNSGCEQDFESNVQRREVQSTNLCPELSWLCHVDGTRSDLSFSNKSFGQCNMLPYSPLSSSHDEKKSSFNGKLLRNRSFVDIRRQLLHRSLLQEVNNRHFKTVGSVESRHCIYPT